MSGSPRRRGNTLGRVFPNVKASGQPPQATGEIACRELAAPTDCPDHRGTSGGEWWWRVTKNRCATGDSPEYNIRPPAPSEGAPTAPTSHRRSLLLEHEHLLSDGYWEATLHPVLLREGVRLLSAPDMVARHRGPFDFGYYLQQRYWFSRAYAGARADHLSPVRRIGYLLAAPIVPFLLLGRMSARVWRKRCRRSRYAAAIPLLLPALAVYVAGEWAGYAAGPGRALSKVE
jgi:hypothetical protein